MTLRLQRATYLVANLERALSFYRDVLGFEVAFTKAPQAAGYSHEVFDIEPSAEVGFAVLSLPGQPRVMALTEVPGLRRQASPRRAALVLECADIDGVVREARARGFEALREEALHTHDGRIGREVGVLDADGNLTVLYRILTAPKEED